MKMGVAVRWPALTAIQPRPAVRLGTFPNGSEIAEVAKIQPWGPAFQYSVFPRPVDLER